jgi:hypothetical protein
MIRALFGILAILAAFPVCARAQNLLPNGDFESGLSGWTGGIASASTEYAHSGTHSARVTGGLMEAVVSTQIGTHYKCTAWIRIVSESGSDWGGFFVEAVDQGWSSLASSGFLVTANRGTGWFKVAIAFTATTSQTRLHIGYFGGPGRSMVTHVDDVRMFVRPSTNTPPDVSCQLTPVSISVLPATQSFSLTADDPDGAVVRIEWDFGDGTRSLAATGERTVLLPASATATLRVADDDGGTTVRSLPWAASGGAYPTLVVMQPAAERIEVAASTVTLTGTSNASAVRFSTDRGAVGDAAGTTAWTATVPLEPGLNRILVQAYGSGGSVVTASRTVVSIPSTQLSVGAVTLLPQTQQQYEPVEITFRISGSGATHPQFPYDPSPPPGLQWADGISVDGEFTNDNWSTVLVRPGFVLQRYDRALKGNEEWLYPTGDPLWCVRFAPPASGAWKYRIRIAERKGTVLSAEAAISAAPPPAGVSGPIQVSTADTRYFRYADGSTFLGSGHNIGFSDEKFSYDAHTTFTTIGTGNQNFFRWWVAGKLWGSAWQPWASRTLGYEGTVPATGLSLESAFGDGYASFKLDASNPIMFQGFMSGHAGLISGKTYLVRVRWRTVNVTGPAVAGQLYGICVKRTAWPEPGQTGSLPVTVQHVAGSSPWHVATGTFVASSDMLPNLALILENTTGGTAYVDECALHEVVQGGALGPQLLRSPRAMSVFAYDQRRGAGMDQVFLDAAVRSMAFKLVISEKQEYLLNHLGPDGLPDANATHFNEGVGSPTTRLHEYYWRHLFARFGAYRSVHSWELVNEEAPGPGDHFRLAGRLATLAAADGNPHPATTSTWATLATDAWKAPYSAPLGYTDFHAYVRGTGWIDPKDSIANDAARFFIAYDAAARAAGFGKPVVWGEMGIDGTSGTDGQEPGLASDVNGVWLHKIIWARCAPGGVYPLYWYTDNIFAKALHPLYGKWHLFMKDVPLASGGYVDAVAGASSADLRVTGQKNLARGHAFLWIDNRRHTWRAVVDGITVPAIAGTVTVELAVPGKTYAVQWYDTWTGTATQGQSVIADAAGKVTLAITGLTTDVAVQIGKATATFAEDGSHSTPVEVHLGYNYPNPFNPSTTIPFEIPEQSHVRVVVFDLLGREVAVLADGVMGPGSYSVAFDARGCATGTYFVRLQAGAQTRLQQMMLVR